MTELTAFSPFANTPAEAAAIAAAGQASCHECAGGGGWYRYEPAHPEPGLLYLSCLHCQGQGRLALTRD